MSCVKVEVAVLGSLSLIVLMVSVDVKQHWTWTWDDRPTVGTRRWLRRLVTVTCPFLDFSWGLVAVTCPFLDSSWCVVVVTYPFLNSSWGLVAVCDVSILTFFLGSSGLGTNGCVWRVHSYILLEVLAAEKIGFSFPRRSRLFQLWLSCRLHKGAHTQTIF